MLNLNLNWIWVLVSLSLVASLNCESSGLRKPAADGSAGAGGADTSATGGSSPVPGRGGIPATGGAAGGNVVSDTGGTPAAGGQPAGGAGGLTVVPGVGGQSGTGTGGFTGTGGMSATSAPAGTFTWTWNSLHYHSDPEFNQAYYTQDAADASGLFGIHIVGENPGSGFVCQLDGLFAALPPAAGTYAIGMTAEAGAFTLSSHYSAGGTGEVVLSKSAVGDIEGTFNAQGDAFTATGEFAVGCARNADCTAKP